MTNDTGSCMQPIVAATAAVMHGIQHIKWWSDRMMLIDAGNLVMQLQRSFDEGRDMTTSGRLK